MSTPGSIPESAYKDEVVHVQKTSRAEQEMLKRLEESASKDHSSDKMSIEVAGSIPESAYKDEVVHVQKTSRSEQEMLKRLEANAFHDKKISVEIPGSIPESKYRDEVVHVQKTSRAEQEMLKRLEETAGSPKSILRKSSSYSNRIVSAPASPRHATPVPVPVEIQEMVSRLEREGTHFEIVTSRRKTLPAALQSVSRPADLTNQINSEERTVIQRLEEQQDRFDSIPPTRTSPVSNSSLESIEAWEIERELVGNPKLVQKLIKSLFFHYNSDVVQLAAGVTREVGGHVQKQSRGSVLISNSDSAPSVTVEDKHNKRILRAHKESIVANNLSNRVDRLRVAYSRVKSQSGLVTAYDIAMSLAYDVTSRRLTATAYGASPLFCNKLISHLKMLGDTPTSLSDFQNHAESLM